MQNAITIGRVAKAAGCKVQTIRYYEQIGLLSPPPTLRGQSEAL
jgi:DNA-binding transcriptional MerR regulator